MTGEPWLSLDQAFRADRIKAGLGWVRMHTLRHMRAVRWLECGADIEAVNEGLGHESIHSHRYANHAGDSALETIREAQDQEVKEGAKREQLKCGKK